MAEGDTGVNALIGALVTFLLSSFVPFVPVLGGGVAGYLEGGSRSDGLRVGLYSGLIALIPAIVLVLIFGSFIFGFIGLGGPPAVGALGSIIILFGLFFVAIYVVGLSLLGGWLGNYVKYDTDVDL